MNIESTLKQILSERIMIIDGAMGTMIQKHQLSESDYRGQRFQNFEYSLKGNNDLLSITQPQIISNIHKQFLEAGADIIETNTFSATTISMADYKMEFLVDELNLESAKIAKQVAIEYTNANPQKPRFVAGAIGPTTKSASISPDINRPGLRSITFQELVQAYYQQAKALIKGGVDLLLVETVFDTLNCKAALFAINTLREDEGYDLPVMVSGTITDASGRTLSGQTAEAFYISINHANILSIGLNCALGAKQMRPFIKEISDKAECFVSCYPNAGLPNEFGQYDESPEHMSSVIKEFADSGFLNIVGGCCGTTPEHIKAISDTVKNIKPRTLMQIA